MGEGSEEFLTREKTHFKPWIDDCYGRSCKDLVHRKAISLWDRLKFSRHSCRGFGFCSCSNFCLLFAALELRQLISRVLGSWIDNHGGSSTFPFRVLWSIPTNSFSRSRAHLPGWNWEREHHTRPRKKGRKNRKGSPSLPVIGATDFRER